MRRLINSCFGRPGWMVTLPSVALLVALGCAMPSGPTNTNTNDNVTATVEVETTGQGTVEQTADGDMVTLTATPDEGWTFDGWSGADVADTNPVTVDTTVVTAITATFLKEAVDDPSGQVTPDDTDGDGVDDDEDNCLGTPLDAEVDENGCAPSQLDSDADGVADSVDQCPDTPRGDTITRHGCTDTDGDGIRDEDDDCPETPDGSEVNDAGCAPSERDTDNDGVLDDLDQCPTTEAGAEVDGNGCALVIVDDDEDGVANDADACPDTKAEMEVNEDGCAEEQLDDDNDGVMNPDDECPDTLAGVAVNAIGCPDGGVNPNPNPDPDPADTCGDGIGDCFIVHPTRGCVDTECCEAVCAEDEYCCTDAWDAICADAALLLCNGIGDYPNETCDEPLVVTDGLRAFTNIAATTDGPAIADGCAGLEMEYDLWFSYTATCDGFATISLCGSSFDTTMAIYSGSECPEGSAYACSDDDCGSGLESRASIVVASGSEYLIRIGGYPGDRAQGRGALSIVCGAEPDFGLDACVAQAGDCYEDNGNAGCDSMPCCEAVCTVDPYCCEVKWDENCAAAASGVCNGGFAVCGDTGAGDCSKPNGSAGCADQDCCQTVCETDFFCCTNEWDEICSGLATDLCN